MEASFVVTGTMALIGAATGIWGLVMARDAKRAKPQPPPAPAPTPDVERVMWEQAMERAMSKPLVFAPVEPAPEPTWPAEIIENLKLANDRLNVMMRAPAAPPPPPPDFTPLASSLGRMEATLTKLAAQGAEPPPPPQTEFPEIERQLANLTQQLQRLANARGIPPPAIEEPRPLPPASHSGTPINLTQFNTVPLTENVVYDCYPSEPDVYLLNIFNLGPAPVLMRSDADPFFGDLHSSIIAPQSGFNRLHVPASINLLADIGGATLSITLQTAA